MPIVHVYLFEGRTPAQKRTIADRVTEAVVEGAGTQKEEVHVLIHDMGIADWSRGGVLYSENRAYLRQKELPMP